MSKVVKAAFTDELGDIDDLLPALPPKKKAAAGSPPAEQTIQPEGTVTSHDVIADGGGEAGTAAGDGAIGVEQSGAEAPEGKSAARSTRITKESPETPGAPTADISSTNLKNLRALTNSEKARNPITARTYGAVVLDAIEAHAEELRSFWKQPQASASAGLFKRQPVVSKRRRHAEPPAQITLQGLGEEDAKLLEEFWGDWGAPSRSAFVDQALTLYLKPKTRRKAVGE